MMQKMGNMVDKSTKLLTRNEKMEGKTASIAFHKVTGEFGPRKFLEPNKLFVIGTDTGSDIRLYKMTKFVRHVFELDEDGMVTLTDDTLSIDDTSRRRAFTSLRETFVIEGRTFSVEYLNPDEVVAARSTDCLQTQRKQRQSSIPTFSGRNIQESGDAPFVTRRKRLSEYSDESIREARTPRHPSTIAESIVTPSPVTPIPARSTPSTRRSVFRHQSMVTLAEEDESNSNDSKYKTPENSTPAPQIVMRSHKSAIKHQLDGDSTPRCIMPQSNNKSRRSLVVCSESNSLNESSNTSDEESSEKGDITITTTSTSASEEENADSFNVNDEINTDDDVDDYNQQVVTKVAKRFRVDDEYDELQVEFFEPPKKRMRRECIYSFRDKSIADSRNIDTAIISKKQLDTASFPSFADISAPVQEISGTIIAPSTVPRVNKRSRRSASSSQRLSSRRSMPSNSHLETDLSNQENQDNFNTLFSTKPKSPSAHLNHEETNDGDTTESSSFTYVRGEEIEPIDLGMSVFAIEQNHTVRVFGNDLMRFSDLSCRNTPLKSLNNDIVQTTPDKRQIESNSSTGRRSSRVIKPKMAYTPEQPTLPARTPKKTPAKRDISQIDSTELIRLSTLINNSSIRKSSHLQTSTADVRKNVRRRSSVNRTPINIPKVASLDDESLLSNISKNKSKKSCTPARINPGAMVVIDSDASSTQTRKTFSSQTPLRQHSIQINHCNTSLINDCLMDPNVSTANRLKNIKNRLTPKKTLSAADESFTKVRKNSRTRTPLTPRVVQKNTSLIKNSSFDHNKNSIKKTLRTPKNSVGTLAKTLLTFDSDDSLVEVRKSVRTHLLPKIPAIVNIIEEDYSEGNIRPVSKRPRTPGRTSRTPTKQTTNIDAYIESDDSFIENKSTPYPRPHSNKKNVKLFPFVDNSLLFDPSPIAKVNKSRNETPIGGNTSKALVNTNTNTKSTNLFRDSLLEQPAVRRSTRTPKSVFRTNSTLDETIFDTSTKQSHSNRSMSDLTGKSMSRSISMGDSLSRNASKNSAVFDDSLVVPKSAPSKLSKSLRERSISVGVLKPLDDSTTKCGRGKPKIHISPINNLTNVQGVKRLFRTRKVVKEPKDDLTYVQGIKQLYRTPKLQKDQKNDLSDLRGVGKLMTTPKPRNEPRNELSDFKGVRNMLKSPTVPSEPKNDSTNVMDVKTLFRTPKVQAQPQNDLSDLRGVKALLGTPKQTKEPLNDLSDVRGVKQLFKTPKEPKNDLSDFTGVKQLLTLPKRTKSPKNYLTNVGGVKQLMSTPKINKDQINDLTDVAGIKKKLQTPRANQCYIPDYTDVSGVNSLFNMYGHSSDDASVTSTTSSFLPSTIQVLVKKTRARRGKVQTTETYEKPAYSQRQTRARRAETPVEHLVVDLPLGKAAPKARTTRKKAVVQEMEEALEPSTTARTRKRVPKQNIEPMSTQVEIIDEPVQKSRTRNTRRRATAKVEELASEDETQQIEEVSSAISTKSKTTTRKRGIYTHMAQEIVEEDEPVLKKTRVQVSKSNQEDVIDVQQTGLKKLRARKAKVIPNEEVVPDVVSIQKTRGRKKKIAPVLDEVDGDAIFTCVENIVDKAAGRAVRVTRTRRGYAASIQTEESYDESVDNLTTVEVKKTRSTRAKATKRVQFDMEVSPMNVKNTKHPKSRRLLSVDDIDSMVEEPEVVNRVRKSARSRK